MADTIRAGIKRSHSTLEDRHRKMRKFHHRIRHVQTRPQSIEPAPQDPVFAQGQLLRSISAALAKAGFDGVNPTALEMFRAATEEYMLHFLQHVRTSMQSSRRTRPTVLDFTSALALVSNTSSASHLKPQLSLALPPAISHPEILPPDPDPPTPPDLSALLTPLIPNTTPQYIPRHFPSLPPLHTWQSTPVFAAREADARKMREKAMEEGLLAEHALRKLAAAAKTGAAKAEKRRAAAVLAGVGKPRTAGPRDSDRRVRGLQREKIDSDALFADAFAQMVGRGDEGLDDELGLDVDGLEEDALRLPEGVVVDYGMARWRQSGRRHLGL